MFQQELDKGIQLLSGIGLKLQRHRPWTVAIEVLISLPLGRGQELGVEVEITALPEKIGSGIDKGAAQGQKKEGNNSRLGSSPLTIHYPVGGLNFALASSMNLSLRFFEVS